MNWISSVHLCLARARHVRLRVVVCIICMILYVFDLLAGTTSQPLWLCVKKIKCKLWVGGWVGEGMFTFLEVTHQILRWPWSVQDSWNTIHRSWIFICKPVHSVKKKVTSHGMWQDNPAVKIRFGSGCARCLQRISAMAVKRWQDERNPRPSMYPCFHASVRPHVWSSQPRYAIANMPIYIRYYIIDIILYL